MSSFITLKVEYAQLLIQKLCDVTNDVLNVAGVSSKILLAERANEVLSCNKTTSKFKSFLEDLD